MAITDCFVIQKNGITHMYVVSRRIFLKMIKFRILNKVRKTWLIEDCNWNKVHNAKHVFRKCVKEDRNENLISDINTLA